MNDLTQAGTSKTLTEVIAERLAEHMHGLQPPSTGKMQITMELNYSFGGLGGVNIESEYVTVGKRSAFKPAKGERVMA